MLKTINSILLVPFFLVACASKQLGPSPLSTENKPGDLFSVSPSEAVSLLAKDEAIASSAYKGIESGESKWLDFYKKIRPVSDASVSESLDQSIGLAIIQAPSAAIDVMAEIKKEKAGQHPDFQYLNWPCGATSADFIEAEGDRDKVRAAKNTASRELQAKIKALQSIKLSNIKTASECKEIAQQALKRWTTK